MRGSKCQKLVVSSSKTNRARFAPVAFSAVYVEEMYREWKLDPTSVHKSWDVFFRTGAFQAPPSISGSMNTAIQAPVGAGSASGAYTELLGWKIDPN
jgi:2-oxoglutarate dehydrogenase E1 component